MKRVKSSITRWFISLEKTNLRKLMANSNLRNNRSWKKARILFRIAAKVAIIDNRKTVLTIITVMMMTRVTTRL